MGVLDIWNRSNIGSGEILRSQIGPLLLWFRKIEDELHVAFERLPDPDTIVDATGPVAVNVVESEGLDWGRWIVGAETNVVQVLPIMPDRPVVVHPELPVKIPTGHKALFFVSIPIWLRVLAGEKKPIELCEVPVLILSNTWFGDTMSGELCYSLRSRARRQITDSEPNPSRTICPVKIRNTSPKQLNVERLCVHVEHLKTYSGGKNLWTNGITITFRGEEQVSKIEYSSNPPAFEPVGEILSEARTPVKETILKRSIGSFKLFSGI
ncbi:MAG TPA: DUF432 domain-containing protein [Planctomycetes bacterium]|nr:DUF432 domain-containing protein [Planctomycetota bacterium]